MSREPGPVRVAIDIADGEADRIDAIAGQLGLDRAGTVRAALGFFGAVVEEVVGGRAIGIQETPAPPDGTFHDWNLGGYRREPAGRVLMTREDPFLWRDGAWGAAP